MCFCMVVCLNKKPLENFRKLPRYHHACVTCVTRGSYILHHRYNRRCHQSFKKVVPDIFPPFISIANTQVALRCCFSRALQRPVNSFLSYFHQPSVISLRMQLLTTKSGFSCRHPQTDLSHLIRRMITIILNQDRETPTQELKMEKTEETREIEIPLTKEMRSLRQLERYVLAAMRPPNLTPAVGMRVGGTVSNICRSIPF